VWNDPLVIDMPKQLHNFKTRLMPRGTARYSRQLVTAAEGPGGPPSSQWVKETRIFDYTFREPEPIKAFCVPTKEYKGRDLATEIALAIQKELEYQKKPGGILNKYGVIT
jgi:hypothetical protein